MIGYRCRLVLTVYRQHRDVDDMNDENEVLQGADFVTISKRYRQHRNVRETF